MPTGHSTAVFSPTLDFHSGLTLDRIVRPDEGGARSVGAMHDGDRGVRQLDASIELRNRRIVPLGDLAEEDLCNGRAVEGHFTRLDARQVDDRNNRAVDDGELDEIILGDVFRCQRHVGGTESDGLGGDLLDAAARTNRLIIQADIHLLLVGVRPLGENRINEGRTGAGDIFGGGGQHRRGQKAGDGECGQVFHVHYSCKWKSGRRGAADPNPGQSHELSSDRSRP